MRRIKILQQDFALKTQGGLCMYFWETTVSGLNCSTLGHYVPLGIAIRTGYILRRRDITIILIFSCCFSSKQTDVNLIDPNWRLALLTWNFVQEVPYMFTTT